MTVFCKPIGWLSFEELFRGRLQAYGVYERLVDKKTTLTCRSLTDGRNSLWVCGEAEDGVTEVMLKGNNNPALIFDAVLKEFGVRIVTEHEPEFWGHETREQWSQARSLEQHETFYNELRKYLDGQPNEIEADAKASSEREGAPSITADLIKAQVAKQYCGGRPDSSPARKQEQIDHQDAGEVRGHARGFFGN
jgi:hypothetical protein